MGGSDVIHGVWDPLNQLPWGFDLRSHLGKLAQRRVREKAHRGRGLGVWGELGGHLLPCASCGAVPPPSPWPVAEWPLARPLSAYSLSTSLHISLALERGVLSSNHTGPCWQECLVVWGPPSGYVALAPTPLQGTELFAVCSSAEWQSSDWSPAHSMASMACGPRPLTGAPFWGELCHHL